MPQIDIIDLRDRTEGTRGVADAASQPPTGVITCEAGCDGPPGKVVYAAMIVPAAAAAQGPLVAASSTGAPDISPSSAHAAAVTCLAGCFDEPAWKDPRLKSRPQQSSQPTLTMASLAPPAATVSLPLRPLVAKTKSTDAQKRAPTVRSAGLAPRGQSDRRVAVSVNAETAPERVVHKRKTIKRIAVKPKQMLPLGRSARHKIIRPANKYQPRPSPQVVRAAAVTAAPKRVPGAPLAIFSAKVTLAETRKPELATLSSAELVRRATRDPVLRQKLASAANDWLNKAKREAGSTLQLR